MTDQSNFAFSDDQDHVPEEQSFTVALDGFEGPLDLLLSLARDQKLDLRKISILQLVEQYLDFIGKARSLRIELAADWLVMAAWLAWLKSRLLLPVAEREDTEPSPEALAEALAGRLLRLSLLRQAAARLMARPRLGVDVFPRGFVPAEVAPPRGFRLPDFSQLVRAYGAMKLRRETKPKPLEIQREPGLTIEAALVRLRRMLPAARDGTALTRFLPRGQTDPMQRRLAMASTLVAVLEMARQGELGLEQAEPFAEILVRKPGHE